MSGQELVNHVRIGALVVIHAGHATLTPFCGPDYGRPLPVPLSEVVRLYRRGELCRIGATAAGGKVYGR